MKPGIPKNKVNKKLIKKSLLQNPCLKYILNGGKKIDKKISKVSFLVREMYDSLFIAIVNYYVWCQ